MGAGPHEETSPEPEQVDRGLEEARDRLGGLLAELTRRRHALTDLGLQLRRHKLAFLVGLGAVVALTSGGIALGVHRARSRRTLGARALRLRSALSRMAAHPDRVAGPEKSIGGAVVKVALTSFAAVVAKRLATQAISSVARARRAKAGSAP
jgi:hypothetical protein